MRLLPRRGRSFFSTNRVCSRCLALKDTIVGYTDESGVTIPPLHPRCRCAIIYDEVAAPKVPKPKPNPPPIINPLLLPLLTPELLTPTKPRNNPEEEVDGNLAFDLQNFSGEPLPEGKYNLTVRRQVQNRHIEDTKEYQDYVERLAEKSLKPSKLSEGADCQALIREFHGKGIYDPNPKDGSPREFVDTGRVIGQYWDTGKNQYVDTSWLELVYSKRGTHIYPIRPKEG